MEVLKIVTIFGGAQVILVVLLGWLSKVWLNRIQELDRRKTAEILESFRNNLTKEREEHLEEIKNRQVNVTSCAWQPLIAALKPIKRLILCGGNSGAQCTTRKSLTS